MMSSTSVIDDGNDGGDVLPLSIKSLHYEGSYTPHKAHWMKNALENLGSVWVRDGKISVGQLVSEEFEEKIGVLYDLAMVRKHEAIDRLVGEVMMSELNTKTSGNDNKKATKKQSGLEQDPPSAVQKNFPFAPHLSEAVKASMSDALLRIMMRGGGVGGGGSDEGGKVAATPSTPTTPRSTKGNKKKKTAKNNNQDGGAADRITDDPNSSNSFENSLKAKRCLVQCYVVDDGKLVVGTKNRLLKVGGSFVNRFGGSWMSRGRKFPNLHQNEYPFFRRTANLMGFLPHEVKIRYCRETRQLIVSGARPSRGQFENARQVREVIEVPKDVDIRGLIVMRTGKGSLIFEEGEEEGNSGGDNHAVVGDKKNKMDAGDGNNNKSGG